MKRRMREYQGRKAASAANRETGRERILSKDAGEEDVEREEAAAEETEKTTRSTIRTKGSPLSSLCLVSSRHVVCRSLFSFSSLVSQSCIAVFCCCRLVVGQQQQDKRTHRNRSFASLITLSSLDQEISIGESPVAEHSSSAASFLFIDSDFIRVRKRAGSGSSEKKE